MGTEETAGIQQNWTVASEEKIRQIIREIGDASITANGGYITKTDIIRTIEERKLKMKRKDVVALLKDTYQQEIDPPKGIGLPQNQRVYNANKFIEKRNPETILYGMGEDFPEVRRGDFASTVDARRLPIQGAKVPPAPHSE